MVHVCVQVCGALPSIKDDRWNGQSRPDRRDFVSGSGSYPFFKVQLGKMLLVSARISFSCKRCKYYRASFFLG